MVKVEQYSSKAVICFFSIEENPTPGSFGDYILYKEECRKLDQDWLEFGIRLKDPERYRQMHFNMSFLKMMRGKYDKLHCVYCGKKGLIVSEFKERHSRKIIATADHYLPKGDYPNLAFSVENMRVCCDDCNHKKNKQIWKENFPYIKK